MILKVKPSISYLIKATCFFLLNDSIQQFSLVEYSKMYLFLCVRIMLWRKCYEYLQILVVWAIIIQNCQLDFWHLGFNQQFSTSGGFLNKKIIVFLPSVEIQILPKVLSILHSYSTSFFSISIGWTSSINVSFRSFLFFEDYENKKWRFFPFCRNLQTWKMPHFPVNVDKSRHSNSCFLITILLMICEKVSVEAFYWKMIFFYCCLRLLIGQKCQKRFD